MQCTRISSIAVISIAWLIGLASAAPTGAQAGPPPACSGWSDCNPGRAVCTFESFPPYFGSTIISDASDGLSSDGRGPYVTGTDGVRYSFVVQGHLSLSFAGPAGGGGPRTLTLNLNNPVPGSGAVPLGIVTVRGDNLLYTSWERVGNLAKSLLNIPVGQTVPAGQINVSFHLNGRFHVLQMGPQPLGHCHRGADSTRVHGAGTTSGTIHRASHSEWVVDLPAGSVGRLFDASHTVQHAVDKGLYRVRLHYEIVSTVPGVVTLLHRLAETEGGAAVVARYRALKRDSAQSYFFGDGQLNAAGFFLLDNQKPQEALLVFRLSVEEYPSSWSSHEGLGKSYLAVGDTSKAIAHYRRSLELNPKNQNATDVLKRLQVRP